MWRGNQARDNSVNADTICGIRKIIDIFQLTSHTVIYDFEITTLFNKTAT